MDQKLWLLVEWMDEQNMFSNYGVVNTNSLMRHETDLHAGKVVFLRDRRNNGARKAQILRVSDNKHYIKELKVMLERQDNQVKNVLSLCMNTIKEMKTGPMPLMGWQISSKPVQRFSRENFLGGNQSLPLPSHSGTAILSQNDDNTNSSDSDTDQEENHDLNLTKSTIKFNNHQPRRSEPMNGQISRLLNDKSVIHNRRSLISSTPLPDRNIDKIKLTFDQGTQTDPVVDNQVEKMEELEMVLQGLYKRFLSLVSEVQTYQSRSIMDNEEHRSDENGYVVSEEPIVDRQNTSSVEPDDKKPSVLKIRRASAQTTNTNLPMISYNGDMATIGNGNVTVPSRLLAEIDWSSHTSATRQLLQAVFPRRILATHSLTGKQSPAFSNKPPKKQLDPKLVEDIVNIVSAKCGVPKRIVRSSITTKCTDEAKLYRNRQRFKKLREQQNQENVPPSSASSNESTAVCEGQDNVD